MENIQKQFRGIELFDFTSFFGLDFFEIFWPTVLCKERSDKNK